MPDAATDATERLLGRVIGAVRQVWATALPSHLLDRWFVRGDLDRVRAVVATLGRRDRARALATYAAVARDPAVARRLALDALELVDDARGAAEVVAVIPFDDPDVQVAAGRIRAASPLRVRHPMLPLPDLAQLASSPALLGWAALRVAPDARRDTLARAWQAADDDAQLPLVLATRALAAWDLVPDTAIATAAWLAAIDDRLDVVEQLAARAADRDGVLAIAAVIVRDVPSAWHDAIADRAVAAAAQFDDGLITQAERDVAEWAGDVVAGRGLAREARAVVDARAAAAAFAHALANPPAREPWTDRARARLLDVVDRACREAPKRPHRALWRIRRAGEDGEVELVREAIDRLEATFGRLDREISHDLAIAVYYPGRARAVAAWFGGGLSGPMLSEHIAATIALAREGFVDVALEHAAHALDDALLTPDELARLAPIVAAHADVADRLAPLVDEALAILPGATLDDARAWLARPVTTLDDRPLPVVEHAHHAELAARFADTEDPAVALVYADFLQSHGDPRGELLALHHAGRDAEAELLLARHAEHFLGPLAAYATVLDGTRQPAFTWTLGFIRVARLGYHAHHVAQGVDHAVEHALAALLDHPSGALVRDLVVTVNVREGRSEIAPVTAALASHAAPALRRLRLGEFRFAGPRSPAAGVEHEMSWVEFGDLAPLWPRLARLEQLVLQGALGEPVFGAPDLPRLHDLVVMTGGLAADNTRAIAAAAWPALEVMTLWFGSDRYGFTGGVGDVAPLLAGTRLPRLTTLRLENASFADELVEPLARSPLLPRLAVLSLALGTLTDRGAAALARHADAFAHLARLDLSFNCLSADGAMMVDGLCHDVVVEDQKQLEDDRFVSVGE